MKPLKLLFFVGALFLTAATGLKASSKQVPGEPYTVGYSPRGLLIDDVPRVLTTGAIHYPRSTPSMWDSLMKKAKAGGLNTIDTYVFWNLHEPRKGHYDFATDRANLPLFLQLARDNGLFVVLRIGPYVCAEWNYGGFPQWLRHEPQIVFRTYSEPFMQNMKRFIGEVIKVTREFMPEHGGPIIAFQIENEYGDHQWRFGLDGRRYANWCGATARSFNVTVPWIMCRQFTKVAGIIPTMNGFYVDKYLEEYHAVYPDYPGMWTEMWPAWFQRWGEAAPHRPIEDISYAVAKWFAYGGTYVSYYMYQGGTNFGRTSGPFIQTSYDYDGFLDEYGLENWPKYLHLRDLHQVLLDNAHFITSNPIPQPQSLGDKALAYVYGTKDEYLAFLINEAERSSTTVEFGDMFVKLHRWSVTLMLKRRGDLYPETLYNTATLSPMVRQAKEHPAGFRTLDAITPGSIHELGVPLPSSADMGVHATHPLEQMSITDDRTDYLWYRTTVPNYCAKGGQLVLEDAGDVAYAFIDDQALGMQHGRQDQTATFTFAVPKNDSGNDFVTVTVLSQTMGMAHNQHEMELYSRGLLGSVTLCGHDITEGKWKMMPGLTKASGDSDPPPPPDSAAWAPYSKPQVGLRWYKIKVDQVPNQEDHLAVDLSSMTKGQLWIDGHHLGRYWIRRAPLKKDYPPCQNCNYGGNYFPDSACRLKCGEISQRYYHLPRSYLSGSECYLYVLEEIGGKPENIVIAQRISPPPPPHTSWGWRHVLLFVCTVAALLCSVSTVHFLLDQYAARRGHLRLEEDNE